MKCRGRRRAGHRIATALLIAAGTPLALISSLAYAWRASAAPVPPREVITRRQSPSADLYPPVSIAEAPLKPRVTPTPAPNLPDLSVWFISREPRYQRYCLTYPDDRPTLCPGTENAKRHPDPGEVVTFTATIANQGPLTASATTYLWRLDGQDVSGGALPSLAPGQVFTTSFSWAWAAGPHTIGLVADPSGLSPEITPNNNVREDRADALFLEVLAHPLIDDAFRARRNLVGSWSFADWMQAQVAQMNQRLGAAVFPLTPYGVLDRVRIDSITVTTGVGGDTVESTLPYDGRWTFRVERDDHHTPEDESRLSAENYASAVADTIDWGLVHELTHQIGMIDLYQMNVSPYNGNLIPDREGLPILQGFLWPHGGLMGGGDVGPYDYTHYDSHTAAGLNQHTGFRRGYFGEYLFDMPEQTFVQVLDNRGEPAAGATLAGYQQQNGVVNATPIFTTATDEQGYAVLPNRATGSPPLTTATGHTLHDNPFGLIDVVGRNGQMFLRAARGEAESFTWLTLTGLNLAYWQGITRTYVVTMPTHLPPLDAPLPPVRLGGRVAGSQVSLWWEPSSSPGIAGYRVLRGQEWFFYPLSKVTTTTRLSYEGPLDRTSRYAVVAVNGAGRMSALSNVFRAPYLIGPTRVAFSADGSRRLVIDGHTGGPFIQLADGRWVGRQGSEHVGFRGGGPATIDSAGQWMVAARGGRTVVALDRDLRLINWFGPYGDYDPGPLRQPTGIAAAGEAITVAIAAADDRHTILLAPYDGSLTASGRQPLEATGISFVPGRFGQAAQFGPLGHLVYDGTGTLGTARGALELWVRPAWRGNDQQEHVFLEAGSENVTTTTRLVQDGLHNQPGTAHVLPASQSPSAPAFHLRLAKGSWSGVYALIEDRDGHEEWLVGDAWAWQPGEWHHLAITWSDHDLSFYVDGYLADRRPVHHPITGTAATLHIGRGIDGKDPALAAVDGLRISSLPRLGNSDHTRLIVADGELNRLQVFDALGNLISSFGEEGNGPGQWRSPQGMAWLPDSPQQYDGATATSLLVADSGNDRLQLLTFDGDNLTYLSEYTANLRTPQDVAAVSYAACNGGTVLGDLVPCVVVADSGHHQVAVISLTGEGHRLATFSSPNDGAPGPFRRPTGVAVGPAGEIVGADLDNQRVVTIWNGLRLHRYYFPSIFNARRSAP
ncbi:MAG: hypothetical protein IT330_12975 [Anaerolineae bacterium]|nr:hypothetical protein [Anaerolineae bacterium]